MRPVRQLEVKVGLLVVAGLAAAITLVLTADRIRFERHYPVTAWLKDAGGLRVDSSVTLAGIAVGKVRDISAEAHRGRIRATLHISDQITLPADVEAQLVTSGIFGDASLAFSSAGTAQGRALAKDGSAEVEVLPGFFDQAGDLTKSVLRGISDLLKDDTRGDVKRLLASSADLAGHAASVAGRLDAQKERIDAILANLEAASRDLRGLSATAAARIGPLADRTEALLAGLERGSATVAARAEGALAGVEALARDADALVEGNAAALGSLVRSLDEGARRVASIARAVDEGRGVIGQLVGNPRLAQDLDRIAVDLRSAAAAVADRPSSLVFDGPDDLRRAEEARRNREKMRRALAEGLSASAAVPR